MSIDRRQARVLRRELHSPKSALAIVLALIAIVALAWIGTESVLAALGQHALLLSPAAMAAGVRGLPAVPGGAGAPTNGGTGRAAAIELAAAAVPGVRGLYPLTPRAAGRTALAAAAGRPLCELRIAADLAVPAREVLAAVAAAVRAEAGDASLPVRIEIASID